MPTAITGTVTSTHDPLTVRLDGDDVSSEVTLRDRSYEPEANDRVWLIEIARFQWMIGGAIVSELDPGSG